MMNTLEIIYKIKYHDYSWFFIDDTATYFRHQRNERQVLEAIKTLSNEDAVEVFETIKDNCKGLVFGEALKARMEETKPQSELSKIMSTAWELFKAELFQTFGESLKAAWAKFKLVQKLKEGIARFSFTKANGETRDAVGTLREGNFHYQAKGSQKQSKASVVKYFDIVSNGWRSCRVDRLQFNAA